eukprot:128353-Chlamydomonas_euryale.AAC.1
MTLDVACQPTGDRGMLDFALSFVNHSGGCGATGVGIQRVRPQVWGRGCGHLACGVCVGVVVVGWH